MGAAKQLEMFEGQVATVAAKTHTEYAEEAVRVALQNLEAAAEEAEREAQTWKEQAQQLRYSGAILRSNISRAPQAT
jgi:hypothetical protein